VSSPRDLLTRKEAAKRLGVHYDTVRELVRKKKLRETRVPSAFGVRPLPRYAVRDIEAYVASGYTAGLR
jgi:excisionase family DNA binding protein